MRLHDNRSMRSSSSSSSSTERAKRALLFFGYATAWAVVPLVAIWLPGDPDPQSTAMILAAHQGNVPAMEEALRGGLDVDSCDDTGITPLIAAARTGHVNAIRRLLAAGAY
jgi:hypothetical protein